MRNKYLTTIAFFAGSLQFPTYLNIKERCLHAFPEMEKCYGLMFMEALKQEYIFKSKEQLVNNYEEDIMKNLYTNRRPAKLRSLDDDWIS